MNVTETSFNLLVKSQLFKVWYRRIGEDNWSELPMYADNVLNNKAKHIINDPSVAEFSIGVNPYGKDLAQKEIAKEIIGE